MSVGMQVVELTGIHGDSTEPIPPKGAWLTFYDPNANNGRGAARWSMNPRDALRFPNASTALAFWRQVSKARPVRDDGQPNRPLTAYTVEVSNL